MSDYISFFLNSTVQELWSQHMKILFRNFPHLWRLDPSTPSSMNFDLTHDVHLTSPSTNVTCRATSGGGMGYCVTSPSYYTNSESYVTLGKMGSVNYDHLDYDKCYHHSYCNQSCRHHSDHGSQYQEERQNHCTHCPSDSSHGGSQPRHAFYPSKSQNHHFNHSYQYEDSGSEWFTFRDLAKVRFYCAVSSVIIDFSLSVS